MPAAHIWRTAGAAQAASGRRCSCHSGWSNSFGRASPSRRHRAPQHHTQAAPVAYYADKRRSVVRRAECYDAGPAHSGMLAAASPPSHAVAQRHGTHALSRTTPCLFGGMLTNSGACGRASACAAAVVDSSARHSRFLTAPDDTRRRAFYPRLRHTSSCTLRWRRRRARCNFVMVLAVCRGRGSTSTHDRRFMLLHTSTARVASGDVPKCVWWLLGANILHSEEHLRTCWNFYFYPQAIKIIFPAVMVRAENAGGA